MILNCYEIQDTKTEQLKEVLKYLNGICAPVVDWNVFLSSPCRIDLIFSKEIGLWEILMPKEF